MRPTSPSSHASRTLLQGPEDDNLWSQNYAPQASASSSLPSGAAAPQPKKISLPPLLPPSIRAARRRGRVQSKSRLWTILLTVVVLLLMVGGGVYAALPIQPLTVPKRATSLAKVTPGPTHPGSGTQVTPTLHPTATTKPVATPTQPVATQTPGQGIPVPSAWIQSGLSQADAAEANTIAEEFSRREMLLDYRDVGTRTHHAGTLTAALPLLTPAAQQRFCQNDKRVTTVFFDQIQQEQLIQLPINFQAHIVQVQQHQGKPFAWVTVSFQLVFQHGATGPLSAPVNHSLNILLVREPLADPVRAQVGGGLGWLVSNYVLDSSTLAALLPNP